MVHLPRLAIREEKKRKKYGLNVSCLPQVVWVKRIMATTSSLG